MNNIPRELINSIKDNNLVLFIGGGLSYNLVNTKNQQLKDWNNLVDQLLDNLEKEGNGVIHLKALAAKKIYEPIEILNLIEKDNGFSRNELIRLAKEFYALSDKNNDFSLNKDLYKLSKKIITTNYDKAFEIATPELRSYTATIGKSYELSTLQKQTASTIFKLHECATNGDKMILFPSNYKLLYEIQNEDSEGILDYLRNIIMNKNILFIGCGMGDFLINNIFKGTETIQKEFNQKHFIITNKTLDSKLSFLTPVLISEYTEIRSVIKELLRIKEETEKEKDIYKIRLERYLKDALNRYEEEKKKVQNKEQRAATNAIKHFIQGVAFHLAFNYEKALITAPDFREILVNIGFHHIVTGNIQKAKKPLQEAISLGSVDLGNMNTGHIYLAEKYEQKALLYYFDALTHCSFPHRFLEGMKGDLQHIKEYGVQSIQ